VRTCQLDDVRSAVTRRSQIAKPMRVQSALRNCGSSQGTAPQHVCSALGPGWQPDPRFGPPPCLLTTQSVKQANASVCMNRQRLHKHLRARTRNAANRVHDHLARLGSCAQWIVTTRRPCAERRLKRPSQGGAGDRFRSGHEWLHHEWPRSGPLVVHREGWPLPTCGWLRRWHAGSCIAARMRRTCSR
jgi:hypothetical protein